MNVMEFGFGLGNRPINIFLDKTSYAPGDMINCRCTLNLEKPVDARRLKAMFKRIELRSGHGRYGCRRNEDYFELARKELGSARIYSAGEEFRFSFPVNEKDVPKIYEFSGITGAMQKFFSPSSLQIEWEIEVSLDLPWKKDISGKAFPVIARPVVQK